MKIFYFSGATLPSDSAQSVHVMKMCRAMAVDSKNNAVTLFAKGSMENDDEDIFRYYGTPSIFSLVISQNAKILFWTGILRLAGHSWALQEHGNPDLAYGRDAVELGYLIPQNVPVVFEAHEMPSSFFAVRAFKKLIQRRRASFVVISESLRNDLLRKFPKLKKERVFVAPDGADISKSVAPREIPGRSDALKVGYTGSLHEGKGMEIIATLAKLSPDFDFHVVGGSKEQVAEWQGRNLPGNIFMHGHVPHVELASWLAAFDILIAPYRDKVKAKAGRDISQWMSPLKIFEYMAARKPMLASDLPVLREVLRHGENALLVSPSDPKVWAESLEKLKDAALREQLAGTAYSDLEQRYSWEKRARNILKFVEKRI